jgi:hypothetical protein
MTDTDLTRLTVNLVPSAMTALEDTAIQTGDNRTDTVNRSLQVYAAVVDAAEMGGGKFAIDHGGGLIEVAVRPARVRRTTTTVGLAVAVLASLLIVLLIVLAVLAFAWLAVTW